MSLRDLLDRITGRTSRHSGSGSDAERRRSEVTVKLPRPQPVGQSSPVARSHAIAASEPRAPLREPSRPIPPVARPVSPAPADAPTLYQKKPVYQKKQVTAVLVAIEGELEGTLHALYDGENKLGRADSCDVVLASKWISREHAMLVHQDGVFAVVPLSDKNHTYVNDHEVDGAEMNDGDCLRLGHTTFRFRTVDGP